MAAPPLIIWDLNATEAVIPDAGHLADGWAPLEKPQVQYMNYVLNNLCLWAQFLAGPSGGPLITNIAAQMSVTIAHNRDRPVQVVCFDAAGGLGNVIGPDNVDCTSLNSVTVTFGIAQTGSIVIF